MSSGINLTAAPKGYTYDQDKVRAPEETLTWAKERLNSLGENILLKTMRIDTGRLDLPVYISLCAPEAVRLTGTQKQMGKGLTPAQSETSAVMELCERFSLYHFLNHHPFFRAPYGSVENKAMSADQFFLSLHDEETDREFGMRLLRQMPFNWVWAKNLTDDKDELIPLDWFWLINEYNGPSAGNCLEEAINQGVAEVIERHVATVVEYDLLDAPTIDPTSIPAGPARDCLDRFDREGIKVFLKDFSLDTGVPTVAALAWDPKTLGTSEIVFQAGTTTDPVKSILRALTEVQQMACDFDKPSNYRETLPKFSTLEEAEYLYKTDNVITVDRMPNLARDDFREEIQAQVEALAKIGLKVYAIETTHPQLQVPACYVIIPGAHFRARAWGKITFNLARLAAERTEEAACVNVLKQLAAAEPDNYASNFFTGLAWERRDRPDEALPYFQNALKLEPSDLDRPAVLTHIGVCYKDLGKFDQALPHLEQARELDPGQWEIHHLIGVCHYHLDQMEPAMESFARAIEIDPSSGIDYANLGSCLRNLGQTAEAIKMYQNALEMDPSLDFARQNLVKLQAKS